MLSGGDVFVGTDSDPLEPVRWRYMDRPPAEHRARILATATALGAPEHSDDVVVYRGWPLNYTLCADIGKVLRMYVAWTAAGEPGLFWRAIEQTFTGRNVPRAVREAASRRWKARLAGQLHGLRMTDSGGPSRLA
jgi:hypothetical protein